MTDFETRVREIMDSEGAASVKLAEIHKLCGPKIDPTSCSNDRVYRIVVDEGLSGSYETIGWRGSGKQLQWCAGKPDDTMCWVTDDDVTVLGEHHPEDEHVGRVYERIEDAAADGMGKYTVLKDKNGSQWLFGNGSGLHDGLAPFTVLHWAPKEV